ncbi:MAG TPA: hypothetical protein VG347_11930, partial [Verrucomicrobiae bacterium]|nr:hypothetical protein [Verrucomicrobiae bacterium]
MKSHPPLIQCTARKLRWLAFGLICQLGATSAWAINLPPSITGVATTPSINDAQTESMYSGATVTAGSTNVLTVTVDFTATGLGTLSPLPSGVVRSGTNYVIGPTDPATATTALQAIVFTPTNNIIPVGSSSNV